MTTAPTRLKIALAQINPTVGDISGNVTRAVKAYAAARAFDADLVVFPELFLCGYPPEDLVLKPAFRAACRQAIDDLIGRIEADGPGVLIGTVWEEEGRAFNAVVLIDQGQIAAVRTKVDLPNYGVFDEKRVFEPGPLPGPVNFRGVRIGVPICEDIWKDEVCECLAECGAELLLVPNGSPFDWKKPDVRLNIVVARVTETGLPLAYVNQVGGQDELVFDGGSFVLNADRSLAVQMPAWREGVLVTDWEKGPAGWVCAKGPCAGEESPEAASYQACMLGLRDYVDKNGFPSVVMGLSGGIDSALVAAMATDALGPHRVHCVMLPYRYTSQASLTDAKACAEALGVRYDVLPIGPAVAAMEQGLAPLFAGFGTDLTEENLQSRIRGTTLMALSNKLGGMVLTTGNKSEMSVGYATLYGDMNGGFNPIKDLYKTEVYRLSRWRNAHRPQWAHGAAGAVIPPSIIDKAPTAELRENQTDQDSLPPYDILDAILMRLVEAEASVAEIVADGFDAATVTRIERLLYVSEYKRRQAAPGVKISARNFGRDRRYPITNRFRDSGLKPAGSALGPAPVQAKPRADSDDRQG
ncbi:MAG: NAD+ synthase [Hyphomicrobiaceae bacterium]|nr:NAD+ synthase [Hyphomicrobiaceae bacterium]